MGGAKPIILQPQQDALHRALSNTAAKLGTMYMGALVVLDQGSNPDRFALAAHGIRELMEKLPTYLDLPMQAHSESLKSKVREIEDCWGRASGSSMCHKNGDWGGTVDQPLQKFLRSLQSFFSWFSKHHTRRRSETLEAVRKMDCSGRRLPERLEEINVKSWEEIWDFFVSVAHHRRLPDAAEFMQWLDALERFLLDRLSPRVFSDFDEIDKIIGEGEGNA
jgi:hypothetical protein